MPIERVAWPSRGTCGWNTIAIARASLTRKIRAGPTGSGGHLAPRPQVRQVSRLDTGGCLIRVDGFESLSLAQPYLDAAFALARGATGIVLDLRSNGGGDPETVAYLAGQFLGDKAVRLSEVTYRDHGRQWWTPDLPAGTAVPAGLPVAVLVSGRTFSCGEALAYHLQARGRVTIVGERTPGRPIT